MSFEILDFSFVLDGSRAGSECTEITAFARFGVDLAGIKAIFAGG